MAAIFGTQRQGGAAVYGTQAGAVNVGVSPPAASLTLAGLAPTLAQTAAQSVSPAAAALAMTGHAPGILQASGEVAQPSTASLALAGQAPSIAQSALQSVSPSAAAILLTGYAPSVAQDGPISVSPAAFVLSILGLVPSIAVGGQEEPLMTLAQAKQYLDMALGVTLPDFVVQAAIDKASPYIPDMVDAGYSQADQVMVLCITVAIVAAAGMPRRLSSQSAPSGASRSFSYTERDLWALRRSLAALDTAGIMTTVVGPDPTAVAMFMVV